MFDAVQSSLSRFGFQPLVQGLNERLVLELLRLVALQWRRVPLPIAAAVIFTSWMTAQSAEFHAQPSASLLAYGWALAYFVVLWGRVHWAQRMLSASRCVGAVEANRNFVMFAAVSGLVSGLGATLLFASLPDAQQAILTMVLCCLAAGAAGTMGLYPRLYPIYAWGLFPQVVLVWLLSDQPMRWPVAVLLAMFGIVLSWCARDLSRCAGQAVSIRHERDQLVVQLRNAHQEAERARAQAESVSRSKSRFLAIASHDLRQPMHALSMLIGVARNTRDANTMSTVLARAEASVHALEQMFDSLLELSRLDAGTVVVQCRPFALDELLCRLADEYRPRAEAKDLEFRFGCVPVQLVSDPVLIERIVRNLLENAMRYTSRGAVELRARRLGEAVSIDVRDTGAGISEADQRRIYDEFVQLGQRGSRHGLGLGLAIVKRLAGLIDAKLELCSALDTGSVFSLRLPTGPQPSEPTDDGAAPRPDATDWRHLNGKLIAAIDDDPDVLEAMRWLLIDAGCRVAFGLDRTQLHAALNQLDAEPDLLIADYRLADDDLGTAVVESLRSRWPRLPAIIVTGETEEETFSRLNRDGYLALRKPVDRAHLLRTIGGMLAAGPIGGLTVD